MDNKMCYLLGALRDATIDVRKGKNYEIKIAQRNLRWLKLLQKLFGQYFKNRGRITKHVNNTNILRINGREIVERIIQVSGIKVPQNNWQTPEVMKKQQTAGILAYIRGFFDAEGGLPKYPKKNKQKYISFDQKNKEPLIFIRNKLVEYGYKPTKLTFTGGNWQFRITRKSHIKKFYQEIGSWHPEKRKKLKILGSFSP